MEETKPVRMRTIPNAYREIKAMDPNTNLTISAIRTLVNNGEIPSVKISNVNFS